MKNWLNQKVMDVSKQFTKPPDNDQFEVDGRLSPDEFKRAGDKLTEVCSGWRWMPSSNPKYKSKYLDDNKQYLMLDKVPCKRRVNSGPAGEEQKVVGDDGEEVIILHSPELKEEEGKEEDFRFYTMYIVYDEYYHTPRMFFSAANAELEPLSNEKIREDVQKEYLDATLTVEKFDFIEGRLMPTVHPCKHANVLKTMSDAMRENGQKVESHFALLIFLKFITSVVPTVEFDITGDLIFE